MKKLVFSFLIVFFCTPQLTAQNKWEPIFQTTSIPYVDLFVENDNGEFLINENRSGFFFSNNSGDSWEDLDQDFPEAIINYANYNKLVCVSSYNYTTGLPDLFLSKDFGRSWNLISADIFFNNIFTNSILFLDNDNVLLGTKEHGIIKHKISTGSNEFVNNGLASLKISKIIKSDSGKLICIQGSNENYPDIYLSENAGINWVKQSSLEMFAVDLEFIDNSKLILTTGNKIYLSPDFGLNWEIKNNSGQDFINILVKNSDSLYAIGNNKLKFSTDFGATWTQLQSGIDYLDHVFLAKDYILTSSWRYGLYREKYDQTGIKRIFYEGPYNRKHFRICNVKDSLLYVTTQDKGIHKSENLIEWTYSGFGEFDYQGFLVDTDNNDNVFATNIDNRLYRSSNFGESWDLTLDMNYGRISFIRMIGEQNLFAGTSPGGKVFKSINYGGDWELINIFSALGGEVKINDIVSTNTNEYLVSYTIDLHGPGPTIIMHMLSLSKNNTTEWEHIGFSDSGLKFINLDDKIIAGGKGIKYTENDGLTWKDIITFDGEVLFMKSFKDIGLFAVTHYKIFQSLDNGLSWNLIPITGLGQNYIHDIDYFKDELLIATTGGTYRYTDSVLTNIGNIEVNIPTKYELLQNYPNPFNPTTKISFILPEKSEVKLEVFNSIGELVRTLANKEFSSGKHSVDFNAADLSSGVYFYSLKVIGKARISKKMILLK